MSLPAYAEELKRLIEDEQKHWEYYSPRAASKVICVVGDNLDRILRDAEIASAAREWHSACNGRDRERKRLDLCALIAKETP